MTKRDMLEVLKTLLQALGDAETPKPTPTPPPAPMPSSRAGWILRNDGSMAPEGQDEEIEFRQPNGVDIVDFAHFIKGQAPRQASQGIDLQDPTTWHP